jgi:hypothetical protein
MATRMQQRRGTASQWTSANPVLNAGELGWESDTNKFKIGDGTNHWADLDYFIDATSTTNPAFGSSIVFEGATANDFETTLQVTYPTADRTITFPDATGTVALAGNVAALSGATFTGAVIGTDLTLSGDLTVNGTTTNINSTNLVVEDKNIVLGDTATPSDGGATGGGITLKGTTDKTFNWLNTNEAWTSSEHINLASGKLFYIDNVALYNVTETLANKTLTSPQINGGVSQDTVLFSPQERTTVTATAATGTINFDVKTQAVLYYTTNASANFTINVRGNGLVSLNTLMTTGDALTVVFMNTNGATPYYPNVFQIDGNTITPKYQGGTAYSAGNASSIDIYTYTILKTASATFTVLANQTKFA